MENMIASRFTDAQKAIFLKQGEDGLLVTEICRQAWISEVTYFSKKKNAELLPGDIRRLKQLAEENAKLKKVGRSSRLWTACNEWSNWHVSSKRL